MTKILHPKILDCTLREGEQSQNILFSVNEKIEIAQLLHKFGVDLIEIGHPGISENEQQNCRQVRDALPSNIECVMHARALESDILAASDAGANWVGIWIACNDIAFETKFTNKTQEWIFERTKKAITYAKSLGLKVRFTIEDASRTPKSTLLSLGLVAKLAGADRISLADTVGCWLPQQCYSTVKDILEKLNIEIEVHLHNDLGLAMANAVAAIDAGASIIDTSILGVGERAGICDTINLAFYLNKLIPDLTFDFTVANKLAYYIEKIGHFRSEPHRPLVGKNVFTHTSLYHSKAVEKNIEAYQFVNPKIFERQIIIQAKNLERPVNINRMSNQLLVSLPFVKGASELLYHRDGIGQRWVCMDYRLDKRSSLYVIERVFDAREKEYYQPHVDCHAHHCDSLFIFLGDQEDGSGLTVSVSFGIGENTETKILESPASVFIPAKVYHNYVYIDGNGHFTNIVLASNYNESLVAAINVK